MSSTTLHRVFGIGKGQKRLIRKRQNHLKAVFKSGLGNYCLDGTGASIYVSLVAFFALLKRERIRRRVYKSKEEGKADIFNYIELFYNPTRRHGHNNDLSPMEYEKNYFLKQSSV